MKAMVTEAIGKAMVVKEMPEPKRPPHGAGSTSGSERNLTGSLPHFPSDNQHYLLRSGSSQFRSTNCYALAGVSHRWPTLC